MIYVSFLILNFSPVSLLPWYQNFRNCVHLDIIHLPFSSFFLCSRERFERSDYAKSEDVDLFFPESNFFDLHPMQIYREFIEALRGRRRTFASDPPLWWRRFEIRRVLVSPLLPNIFSFVNIQVIDIFFYLFVKRISKLRISTLQFYYRRKSLNDSYLNPMEIGSRSNACRFRICISLFQEDPLGTIPIFSFCAF